MANWNPWHGCHKLSAGCANCYVYRGDAKRGVDASIVRKTASFDVPIKKLKNGEYKVRSGQTVWTCFSSDFFVPDADAWREECWNMMRERSDLKFFFITKRIDRLAECVPSDWDDGWDNVTICCTMENQAMVDYRMPIYRDAPIKHKIVICEPLLSEIDLTAWLGDWVEQVVAGGESGYSARPCYFEWLLSLREQCAERGISFMFRQTGSKFVKEGVLYRVPRNQHFAQARKANINLK